MGKGDPEGGRPPFDLSTEDYQKIIAMIRIQCTQQEICGIYGVTDKTLNNALKRHSDLGFSELFKKHQDEGRASLRRSQWKAADAGNPTMLVWLGKQVLGQTDVMRTDHTSSDGSMSQKPTVIEIVGKSLPDGQGDD